GIEPSAQLPYKSKTQSAGVLVSAREMHRGAVCLGTSRVTVLYPSALQACFDRLVTAEQAGADKNNWVVLDEDVTPGTFRLGDSTGPTCRERSRWAMRWPPSGIASQRC